MKKIRIVSFLLCVCVVLLSFSSCAKPQVAMEYKGETISVNMYTYWTSLIKSNYISATDDNDKYWDTKYSNGQSYEQKMKEIIDFNVKTNLICKKLFSELGLSIPESKAEQIDLALSDLIEAYGSKSALNSALSNYNMNYKMLKQVYEIEVMTTMVYEALYTTNGPRAITDDKLDEYFKSSYSLMDMIMIYDDYEYERDAEGKLIFDDKTNSYKTKKLSEDESKAKNDLANDIIKRLQNGESFETLKEQYNENPKKDIFTDGYYISTNDVSVYGMDIVTASQQTEIGSYKMVDDGAVICIMMRKELKEKPYIKDDYLTQFENLVEYCKMNDFNKYMTELMKNVKVLDDAISNISVRKAPLINDSALM
ncbi:MAG: hypothetical protein E7574_06645 [Ruminococcaceae bacterium]|nr:hypothetical protein [Oscillospiraceae bacterium]